MQHDLRSHRGEDLANLYGEVRSATSTLHTKAAEILDMAERLEALTQDTPAWYTGTRARVEARVAQELRRVLEEMGERLRQ